MEKLVHRFLDTLLDGEIIIDYEYYFGATTFFIYINDTIIGRGLVLKDGTISWQVLDEIIIKVTKYFSCEDRTAIHMLNLWFAKKINVSEFHPC